MRTVLIPSKILLKIGENEQEISFQEFVQGTLLIDNKFGKNMKLIMTSINLRDKFKVAVDKISLTEEEWLILKEVAEEPSGGYVTAIVIQLYPFLKAITEAKEVD